MPEPPRKKLRKGTKSCLECRRRKIRCTYDGNQGQPPCDRCVARESACESQEQASDLGQIREPTRDRVDRLEATVKSLSETVAELQSSRLMSSNQNNTPVQCRSEDCAASGYGYIDSVQNEGMDCFGCTEQAGPPHQYTLIPRERFLSTVPDVFGESSQDRIRAQLTSAIPCRGDLLVLTASSIDWWQIHKALMPEPPIKSRIDLIEQHKELPKPSTNPATIATWLLCLAISFLQLPAAFDFSALESIPEPTRFVPRTVKQVEEMLAMDDLAGTLEGIECATVFAQIQKFIGRPKKGWLVLRKAIAFAELLKLPSSRSAIAQLKKKGGANDEQFRLLQRRANAWNSLCAVDRLLCLLLGTPSAISDRAVTPDIDPNDPYASTRRIIWVQSEIHNQIVKRDQLGDESDAFGETQNIVHKCQALARTFPPEWKQVDRWATYDAKTASSVMMQSGHSYLVLRATLPHLLKAKGTNSPYSANALDCLQACRDILRRYFAVRTRLTNGAFLSRSFDVHAFTASIILLLHGDKSWQNPLGDTALLENAKAAMLRAPRGEGVEALTGRMIECLNALQMFSEGEAAAPEIVRLKVPILGGVEASRSKETGKVKVEVLGAVGSESQVEFDFDALEEDWFLKDGWRRDEERRDE